MHLNKNKSSNNKFHWQKIYMLLHLIVVARALEVTFLTSYFCFCQVDPVAYSWEFDPLQKNKVFHHALKKGMEEKTFLHILSMSTVEKNCRYLFLL